MPTTAGPWRLDGRPTGGVDRPDMSEWLTSEWIANDLQVPLSTYYQWRSAGKGPRGIKVGKYVRVRRGDYEEWLESLAEDQR